jgi:hypothetical protein
MNRKEDSYGDELGKKVYDLTWQGKLWGRSGAIACSRLRFFYLESLGRAGEGASALSSTYYTAWGNAFSQMWLFRGIWCAIWALSWSNLAEKAIGLEKMNHGQLDIRGSILAMWYMYQRAEICLKMALEKEDISIDSRALVLSKLGEVQDRKISNRIKGEDGGIVFGEAMRIEGVKNTTRVRALKALGKHMLRKKRSRPLDYKWVAMRFFGEALEIAERDNLGDQIVKIKALIKKVE